jgi:vacuolar protein sorting-associated protein 13D
MYTFPFRQNDLAYLILLFFSSALPGIVVSGNLPQLSVHVNEEKVTTLRRMSDMLKRDYQTWTTPMGTASSTTVSPTSHDDVSMDVEDTDIFASFEAQKDVDESSKLFYIHFCISDLSLELQSRGKSVAQFQIDGLKASYTRRPFDSSVVFSLQSLHLVTVL